jgi:N-succinyldiaminopimelate aminotransferase
MSLDEWKLLFELSDRHGFVVVSDECYSEIYFDETSPPLGGLAAAKALGRKGYPRLLAMGSLSKRSNAPGLRSGFIAGDAALLDRFGLVPHVLRDGRQQHRPARFDRRHGRTRSTCARTGASIARSSPHSARSSIRCCRSRCRRRRSTTGRPCPATTRSSPALSCAHQRHRAPGSFIGRDAHGVNPGRGFVRIALVSTVEEVSKRRERIAAFAAQGGHRPAARLASK